MRALTQPARYVPLCRAKHFRGRCCQPGPRSPCSRTHAADFARRQLQQRDAAFLRNQLRLRAHLAPGARFVFDGVNPSVRLLADADGVRRTRDVLSFVDPDRGDVRVDGRRDLRRRRAGDARDVALLHRRGARLRRRTARAQEHLSPRSCRYCSPWVGFGSSSASVTGPGDRSAGMRRSSSVSAHRTEAVSGSTPLAPLRGAADLSTSSVTGCPHEWRGRQSTDRRGGPGAQHG